MKNYIEELMKLCEVDKILNCSRPEDVTCGFTRPDLESVEGKGCYECEYVSDYYPSFTAEKQIQLIKLLSTKTFEFDSVGMAAVEYEPGCYDYESCLDNFEQDLAYLTIQLIQAKELDKEKVKEILEGRKNV